MLWQRLPFGRKKAWLLFQNRGFICILRAILVQNRPMRFAFLRCSACAMRFGTISAAALSGLPPHKLGTRPWPRRCLFPPFWGIFPIECQHHLGCCYPLLLLCRNGNTPGAKQKPRKLRLPARRPFALWLLQTGGRFFALHCQYANSKTKPPGRLKATAVFLFVYTAVCV